MYKIGICDDDMAFGCQMEEFLKEYAAKAHIDVETEVFISGEEYLKYLEGKPDLDLLFLDIEFGDKINGIQVGRRLRSDPAHEATQIVYVSANERHAMQLFKNRPMDFLIKPVTKQDIHKVMQEYLKIFSGKKRFFEYHIGKNVYHIAENEIIYFQCCGKKIRLISGKKEEREFYGKMADVENRLDASKFLTLHKSYIVNIDFVSEFQADHVILTTGDIIPISQSYRKKVRQRLLEINIERRC